MMHIAEKLRDIGSARVDIEKVTLDNAEEAEIVFRDPLIEDHGGKFGAFRDGEGEELADTELGVGDHVVAADTQSAEIGRVETIG